jgi:copper(I)-binding protein
MLRSIRTVLLFCLVTGPAWAGSAEPLPAAPSIEVGEAWITPLPANLRQAWGFVTLTNRGDSPAVLVGVDSPVTREVRLLRAAPTDAGTSRRTVAAFTLAAHSTLTMSIETYYLSFIAPRQELAPNDIVGATLRFAGGTSVPVSFRVGPASDGTAGAADTGNLD